MQVARATGLRPGAGEPLAAERLNSDDCADHVAVDIGVADAESAENALCSGVDATVDAKRQRISGGCYFVENRIEPVSAPTDDVEDRAENLAVEPARTVD